MTIFVSHILAGALSGSVFMTVLIDGASGRCADHVAMRSGLIICRPSAYQASVRLRL